MHVAYTGENDSYNMTIDYGQNMAGWVEIEAEGRPGTSVIIKIRGNIKSGRHGKPEKLTRRQSKG